MTRPAIHFTGDRGWINDPHGITWRDDHYELFHQAIPDRLTHDPGCSWGHATTTDLLHFTRHPIAIAPGDGDDGIWTGSLAVTETGPKVLYTTVSLPDVGIGAVRVATPLDEAWDQWRKGEVVVTAPDDLDLIAFRDPFLIREPQGWRMIVGAATGDGRALALTYCSPDLANWEYDGIALQRHTSETDPVWMGALWECPQIFDLAGTSAMVSSVWDDDVLHYAGYALGTFSEGRFTAASWGRLTWGTLYAPSFFRDENGEPCLMFWVREVRDTDWTSCLSVPYVLSTADGGVRAQPHANVARARSLRLDSVGPVDGPLDIEWSPAESTSLTLHGREGSTVLSVHDEKVTVHALSTWELPWRADRLRIIVDGPVLEISGSGGVFACPIEPPISIDVVDAEVWSLSPDA